MSDLVGESSSSTPNSGSNSEGSGPFRGRSPSFLPRGAEDPAARLPGDRLRDADLVVPVFDLDGDAWYERWRACSSAILESIAPFRRYNFTFSLKFICIYEEQADLKHSIVRLVTGA